MTTAIFAKQALTAAGWRENVRLQIDNEGCIEAISDGQCQGDHKVGVLLPAIANLHSHSFQRAMAGLAEQRGSNALDNFWTWRKTMYRFLEILTPEDIQAIATQVQMEMLESGYAACAEFHYLHHAVGGKPYGNLSELSECIYQAAIDSGIGLSHLPVLYQRGGLNNEKLEGGQLRFANTLDQFQTLYTQLLDQQAHLPNDFVLGVAPHSLRAVDSDGIALANELCPSQPVHIHIAEQQSEVDAVLSAFACRPVEWLLDNTKVTDNWCLIHATHMTKNEINRLAKSNAVAGLCPITEANLGDGIFPANTFLEAGGAFGIGSDSNVKIALSEELRMLEVTQRLRDQRRLVLTSPEHKSNGRLLYHQVALGGAQALGRNSGRIEVGALADLVALDEQHLAIAELQGDTVLDAWIFASDDAIVSHVWSAGRHMVENGRHTKHEHITGNFQRTIKRLRQAI